MPSTSYRRWRTVRRTALDEVATQQVNHTYVVIPSCIQVFLS